MKIVKGNKLLEMSRDDLVQLIKSYKKVIVDIGTGDGRFVYKNGLKNTDNFYIGMDPSHKQLEIYSKKAVKDKIDNTLFILGSIEVYPDEIYGIADLITVILPWGTLLQSVVTPEKEYLKKLWLTLRMKGDLNIIFGYSKEAEQSEVMRLNLHKLDTPYIKEKIIPDMLELGFESASLSELEKHDLANFETTWSKKLTFGGDRPLYNLKLFKNVVIPEVSQE